MSKKTIIYLAIITIPALQSCKNEKTETAVASVEQPASTGSTEIDLANRGLDGLEITITVPDSLKDKLQFAKGDYTGALDITVNQKAAMTLVSNWASEDDPMESTLKERMSTIMHNIDSLTTKFLIKEPNIILWEYSNDEGAKGYHFYAQFPGGKSTFYSAEDKQGALYSEKTIRTLLEMAKSIKEKGAVAEKQ